MYFSRMVLRGALSGVAMIAAWHAHAQAPAAPPAGPVVQTEVAEPVEAVADGEKGERTAEHLERMREVLKQVLKHLEDARDKRDVIKLNCVNEKLAAVKGLLRVSEAADVKMQEALARRDSEAAAHEFQIVAIARRKVEQLLAESEACVGELAVYSGDTQIEMVVEGPEGPPPSETLPVTPEIVVPPPVASTYQ